MKHPHPSGRPIRVAPVKKQGITWYRYPAETAATPKLRPKPALPVADAIGYKTVYPHEEAWWIGFVHFPDR